MKALILAAGLGTRLRPITNNTPKVLVEIGGRPLLYYHLELLRRKGIDEIMINTHYLSDKVASFCNTYAKNNIDVKITLADERILLGSAGTMFKNKNFFLGDKNFLIVYGDNLTDLDYSKLIDYHETNAGQVTIVCHESENVHEKGMVIIGEENRIINFKEKPKKEDTVSNYVNGGIYVFNSDLLEKLTSIEEKEGILDFGRDVFPFMLENNLPLLAYKTKEYILDIGNITNYQKAQTDYKKLKI